MAKTKKVPSTKAWYLIKKQEKYKKSSIKDINKSFEVTPDITVKTEPVKGKTITNKEPNTINQMDSFLEIDNTGKKNICLLFYYIQLIFYI